MITTIRPADLFPDERVMYRIADAVPTVPSWCLMDVLQKLQATRDELEQIKSGENFSAGG